MSGCNNCNDCARCGSTHGSTIKDLLELEDLCIDYVRALERMDESDAEAEKIREWICAKYPKLTGGGK